MLSLSFLLLFLLELLLLLLLLAVHLLKLLLLLALDVLSRAVSCGSLLQFLLLLLMFLIDALPLLCLLLAESILFLLVLPLQLRIDGGGVRRLQGRWSVRIGAPAIHNWILRSARVLSALSWTVGVGRSACSRFQGRAAIELTGPITSRNVGLSVVHGGQ